MWIDRALAARLTDLARAFPAVLITGARQTGKTSLLRHTFPTASFVSFDLPSIAAQAESNPEQLLGGHTEPLILDEVQYAGGLFRFLKSRIDTDRHRMCRYLMTGSQKFTLMGSVSESLAGRCAIVELGTLSAAELRGSLGASAPDAVHCIWQGGFPESYRNPELTPRDFFASYVATYLERDVRLSLRISSLRDFERFLRACALRSGQLVNFTDLARDVGIAGSTARDWIAVLQASNQVVLLEPYFNNLGKRMVKTPKLYFADTGLACFLLGIDSAETLLRSPFLGAIWETWILNQILRARDARGSAAAMYFWRDVHGTEVDFVLHHGGRLRLIEAKWAENFSDRRTLASLLKVRDALGERAADEHWVACRTAHDHLLPADNSIRVLDGFRIDERLEF